MRFVPSRQVSIGLVISLALAVAGVAAPGEPVGAAVQQAGAPAVLSQVRIGDDGTFDRVVFEFLGDVQPQPTLRGPFANTPGAVRTDPGDEPVSIGGSQVVTVAMFPAIATYAASNPPEPLYSGPTSFSPSATANVVQVVETGDFESVLTWAIGVRTGTTPRVTVLTDPVRVVVDIPHAAASAPAPVSQTPGFTG